MSDSHGNVVFILLLVVALFAALSYAVTQSGGGRANIDAEQAALAAAEVLRLPARVHAAAAQMLVTGLSPADIDFSSGASGASAVFAADGGGVSYRPPPVNIGNAYGGADGTVAGTWGFKDVRDATLGYYVENTGTNIDVTGREAVAYVHDISRAVCAQIDKNLGLTSIPALDSVQYDTNGGLGDSKFNAGGNTFTGGRTAACFDNGTTGIYDYYQIVIEQ